MPNQKLHEPVLLREVLSLLDPKPGDSYLDLTAGYGGHASPILSQLTETGSAVLVDRDQEAVSELTRLFAGRNNVQIQHNDFLSASKELAHEGKKFDLILADLGVSSVHFNKASRGFSFSKGGPLDMRMDQLQKKTAADIANHASPEELAEMLGKYGEVKGARRIAQAIVEGRPYKSTSELAEVLAKAAPKKRRLHPATLAFQAIRIAVNDELLQLEKSLPIWIELLAGKGRLGVISYHSLEDRLVKRAFLDYGGKRYDAKLHLVTPRPITSSEQEIVNNPRARSAKLRSAQRK